MKSKKYHAEVNYDALKNHNNDIILVDDIFVEPPLLMFKEYDSSSISSEEQPKEIEPDEVEEEPDEVEEKDKKILYIINNFIDRKKALEDEEKELQRLFPDYF